MDHNALMEQICRLGQIHMEGNIVPPSWYQHLKYPSGKPYHIAITLFSEIVYWFRPRMVRDEHTGEFLGWAKKFKGDGIQRSYAAWGAPFGFTKRESADAIKYLVSEQLISTEIRDVTLPDGTLRPNVVVVTCVSPERLREITYSRKQGGPTPEGAPPEGYYVQTEGVLPRKGIPHTGYNGETEDLLPEKALSSPPAAPEGDASRRNCLETKYENINQTNNENISHTPPGNETNALLSNSSQEFFLQKISSPNSVTLPENVEQAATIAGDSPAGSPGEIRVSPDGDNTPGILLKSHALQSVKTVGQRLSREDYAFPHVASACAWAAKQWQLALVRDPATDEERSELLDLLSTLDVVLGHIRERAVREKQLTFGRVLDDYLAQDTALRRLLRELPAPAARLREFLRAVQDIVTQWDDAPEEDELSALRQQFADDAAA